MINRLFEESKKKTEYEDSIGLKHQRMAVKLNELKDRKKAVKRAKAVSMFEIILSKIAFYFFQEKFFKNLAMIQAEGEELDLKGIKRRRRQQKKLDVYV
eukprot:CAMPEP_0170486378 /NCGR_PEP_ID=MMETSP0208-20121228/5418_1 /TAXON_ID=197538 /ORGANISM="Strombidium inclinatum, Strain S3" /LENGTH=98 /DNA_ID=CAMNT_0010760305 /DNA_START=442 /DNA_END=738 /DNA_ORIENTATION=+